MNISCLVTPLLANLRVWNLASGTLEEVHDVEFDETNGSQEEDENLDDVRGRHSIGQCNEEHGHW